MIYDNMHINTVINKARKIFSDIQNEHESLTKDQQVEHEKQEQNQKFQIEQKKLERFALIKENFQKTSISLAEIDMKFGHYEQLEDCHDLNEALTQYKKDIELILSEKDELIKKIKEDLQTAEEYYISGISRFHNEFENIVQNGKKHFENSRTKALEQLIEIETELLSERTKILKKNKKELKTLFEAHEKSENKFMKYRESEEERNFKELTQIRQDRNREYSELKLALETEIQNHEKCLEDMKAIYQLNQEKLTYNFKVLLEKKDENTALTVILRKKERFFLNLLKKKNDDFYVKDIEFRKNNNRLTEQSKTITKQYRELHKKFEHFEKADVEKYDQIKQIALKSIGDLKNKIISCNRIIMNQQFGIAVNKSANESTDLISDNIFPCEESEKDKNRSINKFDDSIRSSIRSAKVPISVGHSEIEMSHFTDENINVKNINANFTEQEKSNLIESILRQTEFLMDDKILSEIDASESQSDKTLRRLDLLMKIFSITSYVEANDWLFKVHLQCLNFEEQCYDDDLIISTIARILETQKKTETKAASYNYVDNLKVNKKVLKHTNKEKLFWLKSSQVLEDDTFNVWKILDKQLAKYHELLMQRKEVIQSNEDMKKQNEELKKLLRQYAQQEVKLIYPPKIQDENRL